MPPIRRRGARQDRSLSPMRPTLEEQKNGEELQRDHPNFKTLVEIAQKYNFDKAPQYRKSKVRASQARFETQLFPKPEGKREWSRGIVAKVGDWIVRGHGNELYSFTPEKFEKYYYHVFEDGRGWYRSRQRIRALPYGEETSIIPIWSKHGQIQTYPEGAYFARTELAPDQLDIYGIAKGVFESGNYIPTGVDEKPKWKGWEDFSDWKDQGFERDYEGEELTRRRPIADGSGET